MAQWTDPIFDLDKFKITNIDYDTRSDIKPEYGQARLICLYTRVDFIVINQSYYFLFIPSKSRSNGYEKKYKEDIDNFYIVNAQVINQNIEKGRLWLLININSSTNLEDFQLLIAPQKQEVFLPLLSIEEYNPYSEYFRYKKWLHLFLAADEEKNIPWSLDLILYETDGQLLIVYYSESDYCVYYDRGTIITNYLLTEYEQSIIEHFIENSEDE